MRLRLSCFLLAAGSLSAQQQPELRQVVERLDRLEAQNRELMAEILALRQQLAATQPAPADTGQQTAAEVPPQPLSERVEIAERRLAELDQTKVSSEHRLPLTFTGMLLFNTFWNGRDAVGADNPTVVPPVGKQGSAGATFRQSVIGIKLDGPRLI